MTREKMMKIGLMTTFCFFCAACAFAFDTIPASGDVAYDVYDIFVNDILKGPIGFTIAVALIAYGVVVSVKGEVIPAILALIAGGVIYKVDTIVETLGYAIM
jgi:hypothetical protein